MGLEKRRQGRLKIFFSYGAGVGKTYAMLQAAHQAQAKGTDVVIGCIERHEAAPPHRYQDTLALQKDLEQLPPRKIGEGEVAFEELDIDGALERKPCLILVDDLAHINCPGCRHARRYQDVWELLKAGIDVYTTVDVWQIESLHDTVALLAAPPSRARIPDHVFDQADQVELIDREPEALLAHKDRSALENLTALREIALRRLADRLDRLSLREKVRGRGERHTEEHILVCLSSSPSNARIIRTAARMANAFRGKLTALFVETLAFSNAEESDKRRLRKNIRLAQQLGAAVETTYGEDVPLQIAEFARLFGVSKIVIGRSTAAHRGLLGRPALTDQLIQNAPELDIHIIPDGAAGDRPGHQKRRYGMEAVSFADMGKTALILLAATLVGYVFMFLHFTEANIITVYILGVLLVSVLTTNRLCSLLTPVFSVLVFNFCFTKPQFTFRFHDPGYLVTFAVMFLAAFLTSSLASRLKEHAKRSAEAAFRTKILLETNQLLQKEREAWPVAAVTAGQILELLRKDVVMYLAEGDGLSDPVLYPAEKDDLQDPSLDSAKKAGLWEPVLDPAKKAGLQDPSLDPAGGDGLPQPDSYPAEGPGRDSLLSEKEREAAEWVLQNNRHAGATTDTLADVSGLYLPIRVDQQVYGVVGIGVEGEPPEPFAGSVLQSILGECALALENIKNAREKAEAAILAKNEQLRADLLRAISHDLRTPLTSISGNASNLLTDYQKLDDPSRIQIFTDIYEDAIWLIDVVENLLAVTRLDESRVKLGRSVELMEEVIGEALRHVDRKSREHTIHVDSGQELLLVQIDTKLIVQVVINIVDNAIKYTPAGSSIWIALSRRGEMVQVAISDDGPGIPDEKKERVFDMFYTGVHKIADSRRSLGLGLSLCKSIVTAHGGQIWVEDSPHGGAAFIFTLPVGEVETHEQTFDLSGGG